MKPSLNRDVAKVARGILKIRGTHENEFATAIGESTSSVNRWLKGGTFKSDTMEAIATGLGMSVDELVRLAVLSRSVDDGELAAMLAARDRSRSRKIGEFEADTGS